MIQLYKDSRGCIGSIYKHSDYHTLNFIEDRISYSKKGVIRGFHGDSKTWKLCTCLLGTLYLVTWDIKNSKLFKCILSDKNKQQVLIPPNYLNGHQCLSLKCILFYKWSEYYNLDNQWSIYYNDETINPNWFGIYPAVISERDKTAPRLKEQRI